MTAAQVLACYIVGYYAGHPTGGAVHVVTDDGNYQDGNVRWCVLWARETGDPAGETLARRLLAASEVDREVAVGLAWAALAVHRLTNADAVPERVVCWSPGAMGPLTEYAAPAHPGGTVTRRSAPVWDLWAGGDQ